MRKVLRLDKKEENEKPVEFLECWDEEKQAWWSPGIKPNGWDNVMYRETIDELDYFVCWNNRASIVYNFRGHLNSGKF